MLITRTSIQSGVTRTLDLPISADQWARYDNGNGEHIQNCMPHLSADDREFIMTGITKEEWTELFGEDDE